MYGQEYDESLGTPLLVRRFMYCVLAITVVILHPLVAYVIIFQSRTMSANMRVGFLVLQISQMMQDIFFCLLFQPYSLTPLPVTGCMGLLCEIYWLPKVKMLGIICIFLNGSLVIYLSLLLRIQQALIVGHSRLRLSASSQCIIVFVLSAWSVWVIAAFWCATAEPENRTEIMQKLNVSWIEPYSQYVIVYGTGVGDSGTLRAGISKLAVFDIVIYALMVLLIYLILRGLKKHAKRLCRTSKALLMELLTRGLLYIFPTLILIFIFLRPPLFIPEVGYFMARLLFNFCFSIQSIATSLVFLSNHQYGRELLSRIAKHLRVWRSNSSCNFDVQC